MAANYPTLKDVSAEAGVSMALASVVLNGKKSRIKASEATRKKILDAAKKFGYEPNRNARALRMSKSFLIGMLTYDISAAFVPQILMGLEKGFMHTEYSVLPLTFLTEEEFAECMEMFRKKKIDGLVMITTNFNGFPEELSLWNSIAKVFIGCAPQLENTGSVQADGDAVGRIAAEAFLARGGRKFLYLTYHGDNNCKTWKETLIANGVAEEDCFYLQSQIDFEDCRKKFTEFYLQHPEIDCVMAASDIMAASVLSAAHELGVSVPEKLQVIGVDDTVISLTTTPQLSSIWQPKYAQGEEAAKLMINMLEKNKSDALVLPVHLEARGSIKPLTTKVISTKGEDKK